MIHIDQRLVSGNVGMSYYAKFKRGGIAQVKHLAMYANSTDQIMTFIDGRVAHMVNDTGTEVVASLIASNLTENLDFKGGLVSNFSSHTRKHPPLYVCAEKNLYQVTLITSSEDAANEHMKNNSDVALIDTIQKTAETPELFVVAMLKQANS